MPHVIEPPTRTMPPTTSPRLQFNVTQYENLFTMGVLQDGAYELINGDIIPKMPIKYAHGFVQTVLLFLLARLFGQDYVVLPVSLQIDEHSLPEPDAVVTIHPRSAYLDRRYLLPEDIRIAVEVSDATISSDLTTKATLYAQAGIAEYWVVDVNARRLLIHGQPADTGYEHVTEYNDTDTASPLCLPTATFAVSEVLP
jgi:Uma2 family endonuclease